MFSQSKCLITRIPYSLHPHAGTFSLVHVFSRSQACRCYLLLLAHAAAAQVWQYNGGAGLIAGWDLMCRVAVTGPAKLGFGATKSLAFISKDDFIKRLSGESVPGVRAAIVTYRWAGGHRWAGDQQTVIHRIETHSLELRHAAKHTASQSVNQCQSEL